MSGVGSMTAVPLGETPSLCILCPPARAKVTRSGGVTDWDCHDRLTGQVNEIVTRYARLSARPQGGQGFGRRAPGYHSRPPVNIHNAALRDPRTAPAELGDPHAPLNLLITWASWMRGVRRQQRVAYPANTADLAVAFIEGEYLTRSMDWITRQHWVVTFDAQVRVVVSQLRSATGEPNPRPVGWCAKPVVREGKSYTCGHPLFPPRGSELDIPCRGCGASYEPLDQIRIAAKPAGTCALCGHLNSQHSNDREPRACNARWCACGNYMEEATA